MALNKTGHWSVRTIIKKQPILRLTPGGQEGPWHDATGPNNRLFEKNSGNISGNMESQPWQKVTLWKDQTTILGLQPLQAD